MLLNFRNGAHHSKSSGIAKKIDTKIFVGNKRFNWEIVNNKLNYRLFYNNRLLNRIYNIYREEFRAYNYSKKLMKN